MSASKLLSSAIAAATIVGAAGFVYAQTTTTDPSQAPGTTTPSAPSAPAPDATVQPSTGTQRPDSMQGSPATADSSASTMSTADLPARADRN